MKIIMIQRCEDCPHYQHDPQDDVKFWGKTVCFYDPTDLYELKDIQEVPDWCPLEDAK